MEFHVQRDVACPRILILHTGAGPADGAQPAQPAGIVFRRLSLNVLASPLTDDMAGRILRRVNTHAAQLCMTTAALVGMHAATSRREDTATADCADGSNTNASLAIRKHVAYAQSHVRRVSSGGGCSGVLTCGMPVKPPMLSRVDGMMISRDSMDRYTQ